MAPNPEEMQYEIVVIAQAQQRLSQEAEVFTRQMERDKAFFRLQLCCGWVVLALLPAIAVVSVIIMINYRTVPASMLAAACGAFFVDVLGLLIAAYKTLLPQKPGEERVLPVTEYPTSLQDREIGERDNHTDSPAD